MERNFNEPLVSVCMITYNHAPFIASAIEGVLMQQANFQFELIISDDFSTDDTPKICKSFKSMFPEKIKLNIQKINQGVKINSLNTLSACTGKYIAICEGDDVWIDPLKLQKQVNFLENNYEYGLTHTDYNVINDKGKQIITHRHLRSRYFNTSSVFNLIMKRKYVIVSPTVMFRTQLFQQCSRELYSSNFMMTDLPLWFEIAWRSKVKYINEVTASYRVLNKSASHFNDVIQILDFNLNILEIFSYYARKYKVKFHAKRSKSRYYGNMLKDCFYLNEIEHAGEFYCKMIKNNFFSIINPRPLMFLTGLHLKFVGRLIVRLSQSNHTFINKHF